MYKVSRIKNGRLVEYWQDSVYVPGKKNRQTVYRGAVNPKRKPKLILAGLLQAIVGMAAKGAVGTLGPPGGRKYPSKPYEPHRDRTAANRALSELYAKYQIDDTNPEKMQETFDRLPKEMRDEVLAARGAIFSTYEAVKERSAPTPAAPAPISKEFTEWQEHQKSRFTWDRTIYENREHAQKSLQALVEDLSKTTYYEHIYGPGPKDHTLVTREYSDAQKQEHAEHAKAFQASLDKLNADTAKSTQAAPATEPPTTEAPDTSTEDSSAVGQGSEEGEASSEGTAEG